MFEDAAGRLSLDGQRESTLSPRTTPASSDGARAGAREAAAELSLVRVERNAYLDDPRVFFAAQRTLLAWHRTSIALIGLAFVLERFGLFSRLDGEHQCAAGANPSSVFAVLMLLAALVTAVSATVQYRRFVAELSGPEIPRGQLTWQTPILAVLLGATAVSMAVWFVLP